MLDWPFTHVRKLHSPTIRTLPASNHEQGVLLISASALPWRHRLTSKHLSDDGGVLRNLLWIYIYWRRIGT
jgi:hypothetical protein